MRPTLLIAETEPSQALSTRKLVLETAKFNVLTAHSTTEALEMVQRFPAISAAVLAEGQDIDCQKVAATLKSDNAEVPVIFLSPRIGALCQGSDHVLSSYEPESLLELVRSLLGDPRRKPRPTEALRDSS